LHKVHKLQQMLNSVLIIKAKQIKSISVQEDINKKSNELIQWAWTRTKGATESHLHVPKVGLQINVKHTAQNTR